MLMEFKVIVTLDVTPRLERLASDVLTALRRPTTPPGGTVTPPEPTKPSESLRQAPLPISENSEDSENSERSEEGTAEPAPSQAPAPTAPEAPAPAPAPTAPAPTPEAPAEEVTPPSDQELRTLLDIVISKWAGVGSENSSDPGVLRIRKDVCNAFKQIAQHLGAEKPTKLQGEARNKFLHEIENNLYSVDGRIEWRAF